MVRNIVECSGLILHEELITRTYQLLEAVGKSDFEGQRNAPTEELIKVCKWLKSLDDGQGSVVEAMARVFST